MSRVTAVIVPCPICGAPFKTRAGMKIHFAAMHPDFTIGLLPPKEAWEQEQPCLLCEGVGQTWIPGPEGAAGKYECPRCHGRGKEVASVTQA